MRLKFSKYFSFFLASIIFLIGLSFFLPQFFSYTVLKAKLNSLATDGNIDIFTVRFFENLKLNGIIAGIFFIILAILFVYFIKKIQLFLFNFTESFLSFFKEVFIKIKIFATEEHKVHLIYLVIIFIISCVIRALYLNQPIRGDEATTFIDFAQKPLISGLSNYVSTNNHLFHTLLVHISYKIFGYSLWSIRLPSFIFGLFIIPLSYITTRMFYNKYAAIISSAIMAASSRLIEFSTNARGYTMICFFFL